MSRPRTSCLAHVPIAITSALRRFKLLLRDPSNSSEDVVEDSENIIRTKAFERGVLALPGTAFLPSGRTTAYVRASFSLLPPEDVDEALKRLRQVILDARQAR